MHSVTNSPVSVSSLLQNCQCYKIASVFIYILLQALQKLYASSLVSQYICILLQALQYFYAFCYKLFSLYMHSVPSFSVSVCICILLQIFSMYNICILLQGVLFHKHFLSKNKSKFRNYIVNNTFTEWCYSLPLTNLLKKANLLHTCV